MKNLINLFLLFSSVFAMSFFTMSCNNDPCKDKVCGTQGTCKEGVCECNTGYEQDSSGLCNLAWAKKFIGDYKLTETCSSGSDNYSCKITPSNQGPNKIVLGNLYNQNIPVVANVTSSTEFTIPNSTTFGTGTISGTGKYNKTGNSLEIKISYRAVKPNNSSDTCTSILKPL